MRLLSCEVIELNDFSSVGGVSEFEAQYFGVLLRLLQSISRRVVVGFRFNDG
jgi:hypothetical protein